MMIPRFKLVQRKTTWLAAAIFAGTITLGFAFSTVAARQSPLVGSAERITLPGISNAAHVSGTIYRGAQPRPEAFTELRKFGVEVVVDFRDTREDIRSEKVRVEAQDMKFVSIPWNAWHDPSRETVVAFFAVLHDNSGKKIFVHCNRGADRTGVMVALYRIAYDHWTPDQAVAEMSAFHYWSHLLPHLARYVEAFPATLARDPSLAGQAFPAAQR
jgi:protein tyrosine/serine phosphatase